MIVTATAIWTAAKAALGFGKSIASAIADAKIGLANAATEQERIHWAAEVSRLEQIGRQRDKLAPWVRSLDGLAVVILDWKLLVYDKALGQWTGGRTDPLSPELWGIVGLIHAYYFIAWLRRS